MARKVYISSDISIDEALVEIAETAPLEALLWPWLLTAFDDWGRAEASPRRLKAKIFPGNSIVTIDVIDNALKSFAGVGLIRLYEVDGKQYMAIPDIEKWYKYQTHIRRERRPGKDKMESSIPGPDELGKISPHRDSRGYAGACGSPEFPIPSTLPPIYPSGIKNMLAPDGAGEFSHPGNDQKPEETVDVQRDCAKTAPAGMPGPGQQKAGEGTVMGEITQEEPAAPTAGKAAVRIGYPPEFEVCWDAYPRKMEKQAAYKAWRARVKEGYTPELLLACTTNYAGSCRGNRTAPEYIKHAKTFYGANRPFLDYRDGPVVERRKGNGNGRSADHGDPMDWEDKFWQ
ncbi:MAG: hypothetical protein QW100_02135 [Thermoplasmatales archaeon]